MVIKSLFKIVSFLLTTFLITDFLILIRVLFRNYGNNKLELDNIMKTSILFGCITILLILLRYFLKRKLDQHN